MLRSWRIGTIYGIPLYVHSTFLLLPLMVIALSIDAGWLSVLFMLALLLPLFGCVVLHELGHALMARRYGIGTADITLYPIGGVARLRRLPDLPRQELAIALAGPAVNVVLALALTGPVVIGLSVGLLDDAMGDGWLNTDGWGLAFLFLFAIWFINVLQFTFNMLPMFPMDGGRVLRSLLAMRLHPVRATSIAVHTGRVVLLAGLTALLVFARPYLASHPMLLVIGAMVFMLGGQELAAVRHQHATQRTETGPLPVPLSSTNFAHMDEPPTGFTGMTWDHRSGVGVQWYNGRPIGTFTFPPSSS